MILHMDTVRDMVLPGLKERLPEYIDKDDIDIILHRHEINSVEFQLYSKKAESYFWRTLTCKDDAPPLFTDADVKSAASAHIDIIAQYPHDLFDVSYDELDMLQRFKTSGRYTDEMINYVWKKLRRKEK